MNARILICLIVIVLLGSYAMAGSNKYKWEVSGTVGKTAVGDYLDDSEMPSGVSYGATIGYRPVKPVQVEFSYSYFSHKDQSTEPNWMFAGKQDESIFGGHVLYHFLERSRFQPYVLMGVVVMSEQIGRSYQYQTDTGVLQQESWNIHQTRTSIDGGVGVRVFVTRHIAIRPEIAIAVQGQQGMLRASTGFSFVW